MNMKNKIYFIILLGLVNVATACYYDVEEEIYPTTECITDNVTYSDKVLPIISDNCYSCHSASANFGNVTLEGYDQLKIYVDNGKLLGAMKREDGFSPMPKSQPQLIECNIAKIEAWVDLGALNN